MKQRSICYHCPTAGRWLYAQYSPLHLYPQIIFAYLIVIFRISSPTIIHAITNSSFIHLLYFSQSCCTATTMAEVLRSACAGTSVSQLSALLSLHRKLLLSQEERPSSMLKGVEDSLNSLSKVPVTNPSCALMIYGCCHTQPGKFP